MKAIVLSCDRYRLLTRHMLIKYQQLWPDHPFSFRIPYQHLEWQPSRGIDSARVTMVRTSEAIKASVLALLEDLEDDEMIYWCIDDKYPIRFNLDAIKSIYHWLATPSAGDVDGILFCRCRRLWETKHLINQPRQGPASLRLLARRNYEQIWIHQFIRAGVIRRLFQGFPDQIDQAHRMDEFKAECTIPIPDKLYVTHRSLARFGESTIGGQLTLNCQSSLRELHLLANGHQQEVCRQHIVIGSLRDEIRFDPQSPRPKVLAKAGLSRLLHGLSEPLSWGARFLSPPAADRWSPGAHR